MSNYNWLNLDKKRRDSLYYSVVRLEQPERGMDALREMFPDAMADSLNAVLFSTSGIHGTYATIEEVERHIGGDEEASDALTFLIINPRLVCLRYGNCEPKTAEDIEFLKRLRASSRAALSLIGDDGPYPYNDSQSANGKEG